jgi:hypothetical protein
LLDRLAKVVAVFTLERDVGDDEPGFVALEFVEGSIGPRDRDTAKLGTRKRDLEDLAHGHAVVDGEDGGGH